MQLMTAGIEIIMTREETIRFDNGETASVTFALIPEEWQDEDLEGHPADDSIFFWLSAYEWIGFGYGFQAGNWTVISHESEGK
jgi:hypothetical protein